MVTSLRILSILINITLMNYRQQYETKTKQNKHNGIGEKSAVYGRRSHWTNAKENRSFYLAVNKELMIEK